MKGMRTTPHLLACALVLAGCGRRDERPAITGDPPVTPPATPRVTPPIAEPSAVPSVPSATPEMRPAVTTVPRTGGDRAWVSTLRRAKGFTTYDIRRDAGDGGALPIQWRLLTERRRPDAAPGPEYPALYFRAMTLTAGARTIALGEHSGWPESAELTYCRALGYRQPPGEPWSFPDLPYVVASFTVATMQGSSDWLILDGGGDRLHVIGRHTHDGACPKQTKQGPLTVCVDMQWERRFDLEIGNVPNLSVRESITSLDGDAGAETAFDCTRSYSGSRLLPPQP